MIQTPEQKFSKDGPFNDPVLLCDDCLEPILKTEIHKNGMCSYCGNTRFRNVRSVSGERAEKIMKWVEDGVIDSDFIKLFEVSE